MTEHKPGLHCHHEREEADCTMCTYRALERLYELRLAYLLREHSDENTPQDDEEGQSAELDCT